MAGPVLTYDPLAVHLIVGSYILQGYGEDDFIEVERDADAYTKYVGCGGEVARIKNANTAGKLTIRLMQSSPSNDALSFLAAADEFGNFGAVPLLCRDHNGSTVFSSIFCWVKKLPRVVWKRDIEMREWTLDTGRLIIFVGGISG